MSKPKPKFINGTQHPVNIQVDGDEPNTFSMAVPPCGVEVRAEQAARRSFGTLTASGVTVALTDTPDFGKPTGVLSVGDRLPNGEPVSEGDILIVSILAAQAMGGVYPPGLTVVVPGPVVRDRGRIIGCVGLALPPRAG